MKKLMTPGPTNVRESVLRQLTRPVIGHQTRQFIKIMGDTRDKLKQLFQAQEAEFFILSGSGTLGMDMAISNVVEPDDLILTLTSGYFGERFVEVVKRHHGEPIVLPSRDWNEPVSPVEVQRVLDDSPKPIKAVTVVHNETSTGVVNPVREIGKIVKDYGAIYIVDGVSSLGGMDLDVNDWGIDICIATAYKAVAACPGLLLLTCSQQAVRALEDRRRRGVLVDNLFTDILEWKNVNDNPDVYFSIPATNEIYALNLAISEILKEGLSHRFTKHGRLAQMVREAFDEVGLDLYAKVSANASLSNTITVANVPDGRDREIIEELYSKNLVIAGGLGKLAGKVIRVAHMGNIDDNTVKKFSLLLESITRRSRLGKYR